MLPILRTFPSVLQRNTWQSFRFASSTLVKTQVDDKTGIAVVTLNRGCGNCLNLDLAREITSAVDAVEKNNSTGMILTSSLEKIFCAGIDLTEIYQPDGIRFREFWTAIQDMLIKLFGTPVITAAAVNGYAPAAGCVLALCCEYRAMRSNFTIGLNQVPLGIVPPVFDIATVLNILPRREAELFVTRGELMSTEKAHKIGLVDDVVDTKEEAIAKCVDFIQLFNKVPSKARGLTKQSFRKICLEAFTNREKDLQVFYETIIDPDCQKGLGIYMDKLKKK